MLNTRNLARLTLKSVQSMPLLVAKQAVVPQRHLISRLNSTSSTIELINRVSKTAVRDALKSTPGVSLSVETMETAFQTAIKKELDDVQWIQELLDKTEGGGYIVPEAGILAHKIFWGDMDAFQHVNNVTYLKWFETARVNMLNSYSQKDPDFNTFMSGAKVGPIIRSAELAWRYPIKFPDTITVVHKLQPLKDADRFSLQGVIVSHNARKVAARIREVIVTVDYEKGGIKAPIPEGIRKYFEDRIKFQEDYSKK